MMSSDGSIPTPKQRAASARKSRRSFVCVFPSRFVCLLKVTHHRREPRRQHFCCVASPRSSLMPQPRAAIASAAAILYRLAVILPQPFIYDRCLFV